MGLMALDYDELENALAKMKPRQRLFEIVKKEMEKRGHWKGKPRGAVFQKGYDPKRYLLQPKDDK